MANESLDIAELEAQLKRIVEEAPANQREYRKVIADDILRNVRQHGLRHAQPAPERGRQFAPFAALRGFSDMTDEREARTEAEHSGY